MQQLHLILIMVVVKSINQHSSANEFPSAFFHREPNGLGERNRIIFAKYTSVDPPTSTGMSYAQPTRTTVSMKQYFINVPSTDTYLQSYFAYSCSRKYFKTFKTLLCMFYITYLTQKIFKCH